MGAGDTYWLDTAGGRMFLLDDGRRYRARLAVREVSGGVPLGTFRTMADAMAAAARTALPGQATPPPLPAFRAFRRCVICGEPLEGGRCANSLCQHYDLPVPDPYVY